MRARLPSFLNAHSSHDVRRLIQDLEGQDHAIWVPVGGRENNLATINLGSDPAAGLVERITNAIDAVLEREWQARGCPTDVRSPREAVEQWFGIQGGSLGNIRNVRSDDFNRLSSRVRVTLHASEVPQRPTVDIRDYGIGLRAEEFADSILSLNGSRKLKKLFLAGAFGQGGSTALSYSPYTIIVSRAATGESSPVVATIIRFNPGNPDTDKHGLYEYAINQATGAPFVYSEPGVEYPPGTLVRHIAMDIGKYSSVMTTPANSLWYLAHHYLFDPVLPFTIEEQRDNSVKGEIRQVAGNHRLLNLGSFIEYQRQAILSFRSGSATLTWWVIAADDNGSHDRDRIKQYTLPSKPIVITYNGQKQGDLPNTVIKNDLRLPYLDRYLIVHVSCDLLDNESRRQLFPTTRESLRDTSVLDELRALVTETLAGDDELRRLDHERKQRYIRRVDSQSVDIIRRRLANRVQTLLQGGGPGGSPRVLPPSGGQSRESRPPIPIQEPPTFLDITSPSPRRVYAGRRFTINFRTDSDPNHFFRTGAFVPVITPSSFGQYSGITNVRTGYGTAHFVADENLPVGETATVTLELRPPTARTLTATANLEVIELPSDTGHEGGSSAVPNINPQWVTRDDAFWQDQNWDETAVAQVVRTEESTEVFVSAENRYFTHLLSKAQRRDTTSVNTVKDFYLEHISFHAILLDLAEERQLKANSSPSDVDPSVRESHRSSELQRACETVCGMMDEVFDLLVLRAAAAPTTDQ